MLVGLAAAVLAFLVAKTLGEGQVGHAIAFEAGREAASGSAAAPELASRTVQNTVGLLTGITLFSVAIGGLFSLAYACVQGRLGTLSARSTAALVALGGFVGVYLLPFLKYPANPPAIGNPDTIGQRTTLYFVMMLISLAVVISGAVCTRRLSARFGAWNAGTVCVLGEALVIGLAYLLLPKVHETPGGFSADVLWRFRIASLAIQATLWATVGLLFGWLTEHSIRKSSPVQNVISRPAGSLAPTR